MLSVLSLLLIVALSVLVTRIAGVMLSHTGLSHQVAQFQARSAFTGVGFTTNEAESVVNHPVRRRIIRALMFAGNAGVVSALASLLLAFINPQQQGSHWGSRLAVLILGLVAVWAVARSNRVDRWLRRIIDRALRRFTRLDTRDYSQLLGIRGDYRILELKVRDSDWVCNRTLADLSLRDEGIAILGIYRGDGSYVGAPQGDTRVEPEDTLLVYGREGAVADLDVRRNDVAAGFAHSEAVQEEEENRQRERAEDEARESGT